MHLWENWASAGICVLLAVGIACRRTRSRHVPIMLTGFVLDLALLLYIEFGKNAIKQAATGAVQPIFYIHISVATLSLLMYFVQLYTGFRLLLKGTGREKHKMLAMIFIPLRLATTVTSFLLTPHG